MYHKFNPYNSIQFVPGVGPKVAKKLSKLDIATQEDALFFFPETYQDRREMPTIDSLKCNTKVLFYGVVDFVVMDVGSKKNKIFSASIRDETGQIKCVWFNQPYLKNVLFSGKKLIIKGNVIWNSYQNEQQVNVYEMEIFDERIGGINQIVPIYRLTAGIFQTMLRKYIQLLLKNDLTVFDVLPENYLHQFQPMRVSEAIQMIHRPTTLSQINQARHTLVFDEFFYYQLQLARHRVELQSKVNAFSLRVDGPKFKQYMTQLPYFFTSAQNRVLDEIKSDIAKPVVMNRLLQGDVGSGKTDIAMAVLLCAIDSNLKGVIMAPTQILADQHFLKFKSRFNDLSIPIFLLKSKLSKKVRQDIINTLNQPEPCIIIGTHALIEDDVPFLNVGICIIDEQHRFGVMQRMRLLEKNQQFPHCLFMTATPIPRSFMLTCFGDLEKSILDELPPGRMPIKTYFVRPNNKHNVYRYCEKKLAQGQQVYMVYPLVDSSEKLDLESAVESYDAICNYFSSYNVGLLHGQMNSDDKQSVMDQFKSNQIHLLVCTTVIEVGVDVPNASVMVIMHAERFGLSQLHQLRGRIGRGPHASACFLIAKPKTDSGKQRIQAMLSTQDGFKIAQYDLTIRGPGDMIGTRQSGLPPFKIGDIIRDECIMQQAKTNVDLILKQDPHLTLTKHHGIRSRLNFKQSLLYKEILN